MSFNTVIFDWAGTTVDYGCMAPVNAFKKAFIEHKIELTNPEIREPMGQLKIDHTRTLINSQKVQEQWLAHYQKLPTEKDVAIIYAAFEKYLFSDLAANSQLKPETLQVMEALKQEGFNIGSTTGYTRQMMEIVAAEAQKQGYSPDFIVTPDEVENLGRPYPYMIYQNMQHFKNLSLKEVVKVGDTRSDIEEGKNAGVFTVAVIEGSSEMGLSQAEYEALDVRQKQRLIVNLEDQFHHWGADLCVKNLDELVEYLAKENQKIKLFG
ncbi:phosphonoacetaldehyde hydrolase [Enterococcus alishanensis]|uniref:Phosphonoacetaldehyde hydrolase n=1 Tax=Enterococcus alishanensis TaxID=1303817 RepID=A0ABS6TAM1_9ENTE|nr:phosphonoacetaldehyde hydrolase [Enterococcus alishanensis]MBV7389953.1 phosphonoacetaldehyde hydrolase [Enterococcus alishanensis]